MTSLNEKAADATPQVRTFVDLVGAAAFDDPLPRILVVTNELVGPHRNGGIGTSMTGLVEALAGAGMHVEVLYTGAVWDPDAALDEWTTAYGRIGVKLHSIRIEDMARLSGPLKLRGFGAPALVYEFCRSHKYDVIHFNDTLGEGFLCLAAKRLGLAFQDTLLLVAVHSPSEWVLEANRKIPDSILYAAFSYAERVSVCCADLVWAPSRYILDWASRAGFQMPARVVHQRYVIPTHRLFDQDKRKFTEADSLAASQSAALIPTELVFFGRLEERKGLRLFASALDQINDRLAAQNVSVTFLGKSVEIDGVSSVDWIQRRASSSNWRFQWTCRVDLGQREAVEYVRSRGRLAVMPSPFDNSPCTIYEALQNGVAFLAAATGGIPELIAEPDHSRVLFDYTVSSLSTRLIDALERGVIPALPAEKPLVTRDAWVNVHRNWRRLLPPPPRRSEPEAGRLMIVIDHDGEQEGQLRRTLSSLAEVTSIGKVVSVVVVLWRGTTGPAPEDVRLCQAESVVIAVDADPITAAARVRTLLIGDAYDAVLFTFSGVALVQEGVLPLLQALSMPHVGGLIPGARRSDAQGRTVSIPPLGGGVAFGFFEGTSFTGGGALSAGAAADILGRCDPLVEQPFFGLLDLALAGGVALWPFPDIVFDLGSVLPERRTGGATRERLNAFSAAAGADRKFIQALGYVAHAERMRTHSGRELAIRIAGTPVYKMCTAGFRALDRLAAAVGLPRPNLTRLAVGILRKTRRSLSFMRALGS